MRACICTLVGSRLKPWIRALPCVFQISVLTYMPAAIRTGNTIPTLVFFRIRIFLVGVGMCHFQTLTIVREVTVRDVMWNLLAEGHICQ